MLGRLGGVFWFLFDMNNHSGTPDMPAFHTRIDREIVCASRISTSSIIFGVLGNAVLVVVEHKSRQTFIQGRKAKICHTLQLNALCRQGGLVGLWRILGVLGGFGKFLESIWGVPGGSGGSWPVFNNEAIDKWIPSNRGTHFSRSPVILGPKSGAKDY